MILGSEGAKDSYKRVGKRGGERNVPFSARNTQKNILRRFFYKKDIKIKRKENALSRGKLKKEQLPCEQFL